jgi:hypothetical protein
MEMVKLLIHIPKSIKTKLDRLRAQGTTASGLIRHLLTQHFNPPTKGQKGK